jgi:hypothetical protein
LDGAVKRPFHLKEEVGEMIRYKSFVDSGLIPPTTNVGGEQWYVDSNHGSDGNPGTKKEPFATLYYASKYKAGSSSDDVVYLMPGHAETITAGTTLDTPGINVIGLGSGSLIPTFTFTSTVSSFIQIDAADIYLKNIKFVSGVDDQSRMLNVNQGKLSVEDCIFESTSTYQALCFVYLASTKDDFKFKGCQFIQPSDPGGTDAATGTGCFYFEDNENIFIEDCFFNGNFETSIFHNKTTAAKNLWTTKCKGIQLLSGAEVYTQVAAMSGGDVGSMFIVRNATIGNEASTWGTLAANFFISLTSCVGNDGTDGQAAVSGSSWAT